MKHSEFDLGGAAGVLEFDQSNSKFVPPAARCGLEGGGSGLFRESDAAAGYPRRSLAQDFQQDRPRNGRERQNCARAVHLASEKSPIMHGETGATARINQ